MTNMASAMSLVPVGPAGAVRATVAPLQQQRFDAGEAVEGGVDATEAEPGLESHGRPGGGCTGQPGVRHRRRPAIAMGRR